MLINRSNTCKNLLYIDNACFFSLVGMQFFPVSRKCMLLISGWACRSSLFQEIACFSSLAGHAVLPCFKKLHASYLLPGMQFFPDSRNCMPHDLVRACSSSQIQEIACLMTLSRHAVLPCFKKLHASFP